MNGTASPLVLGSSGLPAPLHGLPLLWPSARMCTGLFLGGKPACLGQFPCQAGLPTSKRSRTPLLNNRRPSLLGNGEGAPCV